MNIVNRLIRRVIETKSRFFADKLVLGRHTYLNIGCEVRGEVTIGDFCAIGRNVVFQGRNHFYNRASLQNIFFKEIFNEDLGYNAEPIEVGNDVWIGNGVIIMPGVEVGDGAILAAGGVVNKDVEPYEIVGGIPATHIDWRFPEHVREQLLDIVWWEWSEAKLRQNRELFNLDLKDIEEDVNLQDYLVELE